MSRKPRISFPFGGQMLPHGLACVLILAGLLRAPLDAQGVVTTIAGVDPTFTGSGQLATNVPIGYVNSVAVDTVGNVYFTDPLEHLVLRIAAADGTLSVVAGNGIAGYSGDGGPATSAAIAATDTPEQYTGVAAPVALGGIVVDNMGDVFFGDGDYVREVTPDGTITTIAGGGTVAPGDGTQATQVSLAAVTGLALDGAGNLYFCEANRVRVMSLASGIIQTYAGNANNGFGGDGQGAAKATLSQPNGLAFDGQGNLYIADGDVVNFPARIRKITNGIISTIAGGGTQTPANGAAPLSLNLGYATGVAVDAAGDVYVYAPASGFLLKFSGKTTTLVTNPVATVFTTDIPASQAYLVGRRSNDNSGIAFDAAGNLYAADSRDGHVCKIDTNSYLTTLAGNGMYGFGGDGGPALDAFIQGPSMMTQTPDGTIYLLDTLNAAVRSISPTGVINTVLNSQNYPPLGNLEVLNGIVSDSSGNIYVLFEHRLLQVSPTGKQTYIIFGGSNSTSGPAFPANIVDAGGLARDSSGNLYVSDVGVNKIYEVTTDNNIHAIAGNGTLGVSPDGAVAAKSALSVPTSLLADNQGGLYFEEEPTTLRSNVVRYITPGGVLKTIAGSGVVGYSGDGSLATQANMQMLKRAGLVLDQAGNLYISDSVNSRVRVVNPSGDIQTFAGTGMTVIAGDGGLAKDASFVIPSGLLIDSQGNLLIADIAGNRIRSVLAAPPGVSVSPTSLSFSGSAGGAMTAPKQITISSPVSGLAFSVSASQGADWLVIGVPNGATPQVIDIRADPANLTAGTYKATLTAGAINGAPVDTNLAVTFQVGAGANPHLAVDSSSLTFTFPRQPTSTLAQQVRVQNSGTGSLAFSASVTTASGGSWLSVSPQSGSATPNVPGTVTVTANPAGLSSGTYTGTVVITSSTTSQTVPVPVTMTISTLDQAIQLSHSAVSFTAVASAGVVPSGSFAVTNIGRGSMKFSVSTTTLSGGQQWLTATPTSGTSTAGAAAPLVTVSVNQTNLAAGFYYGAVHIASADAANSPQVVTIALRVLAAGQDPGPTVQPTDIVFHTVAGAPSPGSVNLLVYNLSATPQSYVSNVVASNANDQFGLDPRDGILNPAAPTRFVVQPLTSTLSAGVYTAELTLQFSDGTLQRVGLRTIVAPATATPSDAGARDEPDATAGCTPTQLVPIITTLGQSFGVPAAWPVALESEVRDDCGNTLDSGSVKVSFSNGDPPVSLLPLQTGMWQNTWQSGNSTGPVTLTLTATNTAQNLTGTRVITGGLGDPSPAPVLASAVNGASFAANVPLAPSSFITLFGQNLANGSAAASLLPLGPALAGATAIMAGVELPLIYGSSGQVNALVSSGININTSQQILVQRDNTYSIPISVNVAASAPAVFPYLVPGDPSSQGAIANASTYAVADPNAPVTAGDVLAIYCTGLGALSPTVPDGAAAPSSPLSYTAATPTVTVGGKNAPVAFAGLAPGFVSLYQINATVPSGITPSSQVPVVVSIAGETGPPVTIAVK